ncbi:hypothetical protein [Sphingomonas sp.]|uniref:hypothetical protein n=1 Tax=Sphingomonas sp. TaxID=28214 RepID=UPI003D6D1FF3
MVKIARTSRDLVDYVVYPGPNLPVTGLKAAATTDSAIVTETTIKVLKARGKPVHAAIMVQAAVEPFMTNHADLITFLFYEAKTGRAHQLDSLGGFPSGLPSFKPVPTGTGPYASPGMAPSGIIPGFLPGLKAIHEKFCTRPWAELCEGAVSSAESGNAVSNFEYGVNIFGEKFIAYFPEGRGRCAADAADDRSARRHDRGPPAVRRRGGSSQARRPCFSNALLRPPHGFVFGNRAR